MEDLTGHVTHFNTINNASEVWDQEDIKASPTALRIFCNFLERRKETQSNNATQCHKKVAMIFRSGLRARRRHFSCNFTSVISTYGRFSFPNPHVSHSDRSSQSFACIAKTKCLNQSSSLDTSAFV